MAWWKEIREEGHPDKQEGWPELHTVADLTEILTTIAYNGSAHHAAVNFGKTPRRPSKQSYIVCIYIAMRHA